MGNKRKSSSKKKSKNSDKKQKRKQIVKFETRRDKLLSLYEDELLEMWFGDDEEAKKRFGLFLIEQENLFSEASMDGLLSDKTYYEEKLEELQNHKCKNIRDMINTLDKMAKVRKKIRKGKAYKKIYKEKDLGIATYLNSNRYKKKLLSTKKYRKELKNIAKREEEERKEMRKLGYIKSKDPDKELNKLLKANEAMTHALSDAYIQKHFI